LKANSKGRKQEKEANKETKSATNEKRENALEWANQRQGWEQVWQGSFRGKMSRGSRVGVAESTPFHSFLVSGHKVFDKQGYPRAR
jgi:hypothetical protein